MKTFCGKQNMCSSCVANKPATLKIMRLQTENLRFISEVKPGCRVSLFRLCERLKQVGDQCFSQICLIQSRSKGLNYFLSIFLFAEHWSVAAAGMKSRCLSVSTRTSAAPPVWSFIKVLHLQRDGSGVRGQGLCRKSCSGFRTSSSAALPEQAAGFTFISFNTNNQHWSVWLKALDRPCRMS